MVTLRQLEYLTAVADHASFTRAAEALHVTQPALSHQIRAVEREVGVPLLERLPRTVQPTAAGRAMLGHARAAIARTDAAVAAARRVAGLVAGELRLATVYSVSLGILPAALTSWSRDHPDVDVRLYEHRHANELADAMANGQADLAIGPEPADWTGPIYSLGTEEFVVAVAADDPLALRDSTEIDLRDLSHKRWVHFTPDNGLADVLDSACSRAGFQPSIAVRTEQTASAPLLAAAGLGPTLVPANVIPENYPGALLKPRPLISRVLTAYSRTNPDDLSRAFVAELLDSASAKLTAIDVN
jgi:DNA-binding transcriptional LysR family regulator